CSYIFTGANVACLYVYKNVKLRRQDRTIFTAAEISRRIREMGALVEGVTPVVCDTELEAAVRELRLIAEHKPPFKRRSRNPERACWVTLTPENYPRLSIVRSIRDRSEERRVG